MINLEKQIMAMLPEDLKKPETRLQRAAQRIVMAFDRQFMNGGDGAWLPNKSQTRVMVKSGTLANSRTVAVDPNSMSITLRWGGAAAAYATIHQVGGIAKHPGSDKVQSFIGKDGKRVVVHSTPPHDIPIPARPFQLSAEDQAYIRSQIGEFTVTTNFTPNNVLGARHSL
jgi:phage gpG-like protein